MKALQWLAAAAVVGLAGSFAAADDKKADNAKLIVGKWEVTKSHEQGPPTGTSVEFTKDGKVIITGERDGKTFKLEGDYKVNGEKFSITSKQGDQERTQEITIKKLDDTTLATSNQAGKEVEMTRKK